jgi:hypothetical protein
MSIDPPSVNAIRGSGGAEMGQSSPVFHTAEEQCIAVSQ